MLRKMEETELSPTYLEFFETIKIENAQVFYLSYHQKRYESVLRSFGVYEYKNLKDYIDPPAKGLYRCRLVYKVHKKTHSIDVAYIPYKKKDIQSLQVVYDDTLEYRYKSTNRDRINKLFLARGRCDDILVVKNSLVTDTSIANIAFYDDAKGWITPKEPLLKGTTRERLLEEGFLSEKDIEVQELKHFSKIALVNAMIGFDVIKGCQILL